jgi:uncharacterized membrane protein YfcA
LVAAASRERRRMMDTSLIVCVALGAMAGGLVQGLSGFAFGLAAMAFWAWVVSPQLAGAMVVFGALLGQLLALSAFRRSFHPGLILPFVLGGALGVPLGVALLFRVDQNIFKAAVGTVLVLWCPVMLLRRLPRVSAGGRWADAAAGFIGGIMGGLAGLSGPVPTLWCTLRGWDKDTQRAIFQAFNLSMQVITLASYAATGVVTGETLALFIIVAPAMLLPNLLGLRLYTQLGSSGFRHLVLILLALSGIGLLASALAHLLRFY